jgi:tRNA-specific 2-thiouridylase
VNEKLRIAVGMSGGVDSSYAAYLLHEQGHLVVGLTMTVFGGRGGADTGGGRAVSVQALDNAAAKAPEKPSAPAGPARSVPTYMTSRPEDESRFFGMDWPPSFHRALPPAERLRHACYGPSQEQNIESARRVCERLGIPHHTIDLKEEYRREVLDYFRAEYLRGRTPNPCARCNPAIKFGFLLQKAAEQGIGFDRFATGHYARVAYDPEKKRYRLKRGKDEKKDQSYFLYGLREEQLSRLLFPLGELEKREVKRRAAEAGLPVCERPESQNFAEGGHAALFADQQVLPGPILDPSGKRIGTHRGIVHYTVGQRRGIGISASRPLYVLRVDAGRNALVVGPREQLLSRTLVASGTRFLGVDPPREPLRAQAQIRHNHQAADGELIPLGSREVKFVFDLPQLAVAPGQSAVFYRGELLLGGGEIRKG